MRVGIIGFGFAGLMAASNLMRLTKNPLTFYIIDDHADGFGAAYSTTNPEHLLNVRASGMSAWLDAPDDFVQWLRTPEAASKRAKHGIKAEIAASDFAPRVLYSAYLQHQWQATQALAATKQCDIKLVPSRAVAIQKTDGMAILTERGDAMAVDRIILAAGHEVKAIFPQVKSTHIIQNPWAVDALKGAKKWASPVMLMGAGLTAVDMVLSLRRAGYKGEIIATSRRGWLPQTHAEPNAVFAFTAEEIAAQQRLSQWVRLVRKKIREVGDWRVVLDALRPHTHAIWQRLGTGDQQRFLSQLLPLWNVHRHRMAPEIAACIDTEIAAKKLRVLASKHMQVRSDGDLLSVATLGERFTPSRIINCTGMEMNLARSSSLLLKQLLADGQVETHANGLGVATDRYRCAWGTLHPNLYVIGSLLTGQLLESTAVPELRAQAAGIAHAIVRCHEW
jgi:uncharacterized NAD(P)/FAD-binding protein YdhS